MSVIKKLFKENLHKFSGPLEFNDPFDCRLNLKKTYSIVEYHNYLLRKGLSYYLIENNMKLYRQGQINLIKIINSISDTQLKKARILCLTTNYDNLLMWAHYANKHQGICIGYHVKQFGKDYYIQLNKNDLNGIASGYDYVRIEKVTYSKKMPKRHDFLNGTEQSFRNFLLTKSYEWKYENEYRCILSEDNLKNKLIHFHKNDIAEILIGSNAQENILQEIQKYTDPKTVKIYKMSLDNESYKLKKNLNSKVKCNTD